MNKKLQVKLEAVIQGIKNAPTPEAKVEAQKEAILVLGEAFLPEAKETIKTINTMPETTQDHYGDYLRVLTNMTGLYRYGFIKALMDAGAGDGLQWAIRVMNGE